MYSKSIIASALLATCVAATNYEAVAPPPAAYTPPAVNTPPAANVQKQEPPPMVYTPPAAAPPAASVQKQEPPPMVYTPPAAAPPAKPAMDWADVKGGKQQALNVHLVAVGDNNGSLKYFPDTVHAMPGDIVQFQFHPKNHTVTESSFDAPCKAKDASLATPQRPGLRSGFIPVTGQEDTTPVYNVLVNDTEPIWIFCGQMPHCMRGMSMVINPPNNPERTIQKYQEAAAALPPPPGAPAGSAPPASPPAGGASPPAGSPPAGGAGGAASPPSPPPSAASPPSGGNAPETPAAAGAQSSTDSGPATFTGAASKTSSFGLGALFLGVVALL